MKQNSLRHHMESQHGDTIFSCKQCNFTTKGWPYNILLPQSILKPIYLPFSFQTLLLKPSLKLVCNLKHIFYSSKYLLSINVHKKNLSFHSKTVLNVIYVIGRNRLQSHIRRWHKSDQPYPCDTCDEAFSTRAHFNTHMESVHGGQKHRYLFFIIFKQVPFIYLS